MITRNGLFYLSGYAVLLITCERRGGNLNPPDAIDVIPICFLHTNRSFQFCVLSYTQNCTQLNPCDTSMKKSYTRSYHTLNYTCLLNIVGNKFLQYHKVLAYELSEENNRK